MDFLFGLIRMSEWDGSFKLDSSRPPTIFESLAIIEIARLFDLCMVKCMVKIMHGKMHGNFLLSPIGCVAV